MPENNTVKPTPREEKPAVTDAPMPLPLLEETSVGSYFVSNYPPYSFWKSDQVAAVHSMLERPPAAGTPLGVYLHIPFCRKRCHFCYFKVYTDKDSSEIERYLDAVAREMELYCAKPIAAGRKPKFVYFGGGTPSYISSRQLTKFSAAIQAMLPWDEAEEVTFECEPGTLTEGKLTAIREIGVTRLSLGIENFDDEILKLNGRAHLSKEIERSYRFARSIGFAQINIDLIAGMMGESETNWRRCVRRAIELDPDSVTVYQMEIPFNTTISKELQIHGQIAAPVADWGTKRAWVDYAFSEFEKAGYSVGSAYTVVKDPARTKFLYRDLLWRGADMFGLGVASFSHVGGVHFQNEHEFGNYIGRLSDGQLPVLRAHTPTEEERMIRELILQMKLGTVRAGYFRSKFRVDIGQRFQEPLERLRQWGLAESDRDGVRLSREGLLQVDRLLPEFFLPRHRNARYT